MTAATPTDALDLTVDVPGWMAPAESTAPTRAFLRRLGHDARGWGLGVNGSDVEATGELFLDRLEHLVDRTERPANLVGWSLGGVIARESARRRPDLVHRVVTFGTPAVGGPTRTVGASTYGAQECARIEALKDELNRTDPITVPIRTSGSASTPMSGGPRPPRSPDVSPTTEDGPPRERPNRR